MKIVIVGAGQVSGTFAQHLASEANNITLVDSSADLKVQLDIRAGHRLLDENDYYLRN